MTSFGLIIPQRASMFGVAPVRELLDLAPVAEQSGLFDTVWEIGRASCRERV